MSAVIFTSERNRASRVRSSIILALAVTVLTTSALVLAIPLGLSFVGGGIAPMLILSVYFSPALSILAALVVTSVMVGGAYAALHAWHGHNNAASHRGHLFTN
jgi:hypothetical protein